LNDQKIRIKRDDTSVFKIIYTKFKEFIEDYFEKNGICLEKRLFTNNPNLMSF
jgi:hypothetical protein